MNQPVPPSGLPTTESTSVDRPDSGQRTGAIGSSERSAFHDYGKMLAVGTVGLAIDFGLFNLLLQVGWNAVWANLLALVVAGLVTFKGNLSLTFAHRNVADRRQALLRFAIVTVLSVLFVEAAVALAGLLSASVVTLNLVKAGVTAIAVVARFYSYREWVFQHSMPPQVPGTQRAGNLGEDTDHQG